MRRAVAERRIFRYLVLSTASVGLLCGFLATVLDRKEFPTFGTGVWWAVVTLGTVGYGDVVPHSAWGRLLGCAVIVVGVTFIAYLTATVTSYFVSAEQEQAKASEQAERLAQLAESQETLRRIEQRLEAIERRLGG